MKKLSIVTTLYCSAPFIQEYYDRISRAALKITESYELILVNDGSPDDSLKRAIALCKSDERVRVVDLSRNFGHHKAILAGLAYAKGEQVFLIDADLEESPELLIEFHDIMMRQEEQIDVVYGVQYKRKGSFFEKATGSLFYKIFNLLSGVKLNENILTVRLMSNRYVKSLIKFKESELFLAGVFELVGFNQLSLQVKKGSVDGSTYTLRHKLNLMSRGITSFSSTPMKLSLYCGFLMAAVSFFIGLYLVIRKTIYGDLIDPGWTSIMVSIWFVGGMLLFGIGTLGIYLSKVYSEVKNRPNHIVRKVYDNSSLNDKRPIK